MSAAIFGNVTSIMLRLSQKSEEFHERLTNIKEFINFYRMPKTMGHRLQESFQSAYDFSSGMDMNSVSHPPDAIFPRGRQDPRRGLLSPGQRNAFGSV
ncbi:unnamed protein product [Protopolystoma xenopodis]|uniref:Uncharacterized protein n=1 Tax=Protopolystoma xenopodis TaxID=117903 RepID=A0A3S5B4N2_9PLAT|nr:unnamed protein product [Protopolystoma xenopodis]